MKRKIAAAALLGLTLVGCQTSTNESAVKTSPYYPTNEVELTGPDTYKGRQFDAQNESGEAFTLQIDRKTISDCFQTTGYRTTKLGDKKYLVEIEPLMVPAVMCTEDMYHEFETGTEIEIEADSSGYNFATIIVLDRTYGHQDPEITVKGDGKVSDGNSVALDVWGWFSRSNNPFTIEIDRRTVQACGKSLDYKVTDLQDGYFVDIEALHRLRMPCHPDMVRDIELGVEIDVKANEHGYQWGRLITSRHLYNEAEPANVKIKKEHQSGDLEGMDKVIECNAYAEGQNPEVFQLRIGLGYKGGREELVLQSRRNENASWITDFNKEQTTAVYEGEGVTAMLGEGLADQNYKAKLDWKNDSRLQDRCFAFLPNYDFELNQVAERKQSYTGELTFWSNFASNPEALDCPIPQIAPAKKQKMYLKCFTVE